jgi:hypothetical protein
MIRKRSGVEQRKGLSGVGKNRSLRGWHSDKIG